MLLKFSPWNGLIRFGKQGNLIPRFMGPFKVLQRIWNQAYKFELSAEQKSIHNTFHVIYLRKFTVDVPKMNPLLEIRIDESKMLIEEPEAIVD